MPSLSEDDLYRFIIIFICILLSAFFSAAENSFHSLSTQRIKYILKNKGPDAKSLNFLLNNPERVLITILIFKNFVNVFAAACMTLIFSNHFGNLALGLTVGILTMALLLFGEIFPRTIVKSHLESTSLLCMRVIYVLEIPLRPLTKVFSWFKSGITNAISEDGKNTSNASMTEEELEFLVSESEKAGVIEDIKKDIIEGAFDFDDTTVREIMTARTDLTAVSTEETFSNVLNLCLESGHSRIPVYNDSIDNVTGVILAKDLLKAIARPGTNRDQIKITSLMRPPFFVPESKSIMDTFKVLKSSKTHLAIIIDEYGGTAGIVTMEDILEEIVGDIQDEFDTEEADIVETNPNEFEASGSANIFDLIDFLGYEENDFNLSEAETLGGWFTQNASDMPSVGQIVKIGPLTLEVLEIDRHRIDKVKIVKDPNYVFEHKSAIEEI